jgi:uncharacterized damage-inducible protein DinB
MLNNLVVLPNDGGFMIRRIVLSLGLLLIVTPVFAQSPQTAPAPVSGFRAEYLEQIDEVGKKLVELSEAVPADKYSWKPAEGVRSVSEVYVHVAVGDYFLTKLVGMSSPVDPTPQMEKSITEKSEVVKMLKESLDHVHETVLKISDDDLNKPANFFGQQTTVRGVLLRLGNHLHEHLGQSIAYARSIGVTPPWSAKGE